MLTVTLQHHSVICHSLLGVTSDEVGYGGASSNNEGGIVRTKESSSIWDAGTYTVLQGNHGSEELDLTDNHVVYADVTYGRVFIVGTATSSSPTAATCT